ncbi:MAG: hypothetical protein ABJH68_06505 [Ilumatobacter sp.]|uniref:hypothetical protein n=1 Tax=Ilumatobacter sp. TaxID=1967498 RepID=UPI003297B3D5
MSSRGLGMGVTALAMGATMLAMVGAPTVQAADCAPAGGDVTGADSLAWFFGSDDAAGIAGADYAHAVELPDGRTLWYFQDVFFGADNDLSGDDFAHNAALVQDGDCFERLVAAGGDGNSWIGSWVETDLQNWLWPLDAEVGADGHLWLFLAEVQNPNGSGAARGALPVGTWVARYSLPDLQLVGMEPAPDSSRSLFGYSVVSDDEYSYLYGHCYRQFDQAGVIGFDPDCSPHSYVARVPVGEFDQALEYWTSAGWSDDRSDRLPVLSSELSMPMSVQRFGDVYVAASDEGDWFGDDVVVYTAPAPQGPWTESLRYTPETKCGDACNNYGAFVLPELQGDQVVIAQSNNATDMTEAFANASLYRSSVRAVEVPGVSSANLTRAPDMELARAEPEPQPQVAAAPDSTVATVMPSEEIAVASVAPELRPTTIDLDVGAEVRGQARLAGLAALLVLVGTSTPLAAMTLLRARGRSRGRRLRALGRVRAGDHRLHHA